MVAFASPSPFVIENPADRRMFPRKEVAAKVEGRRLDHTVDARRNPNLTLHLRDLSLGGLSALSEVRPNRGQPREHLLPGPGPKPRVGCLWPRHPLRAEHDGLPPGDGVRLPAGGIKPSFVNQSKKKGDSIESPF